MQQYLTLVRREIGSFFNSWNGYVVIAVVVFLFGLCFVNMIEVLTRHPAEQPLMEVFYNTVYFWFILLLASPMITMRSFALEKWLGTFDTLMSAPISDAVLVMAKFTGALLFYLLCWLPLLPCLWVTHLFSNDPSILDAGTVASAFLGILLLGGLFMSLGCFASALTRSQVIAAMGALFLGISLFLLSFLSMAFSGQTGWVARLFAHLSLVEHMREFARGYVDTRPVVFYLSLTALFLFLTHRVVESRRWK